VAYLDYSGELASISATIQNLSTLSPLDTPDDRSNDSFSSFNSFTSAARARVFSFRPTINVIQMVDICPQLGMMVQSNPLSFRKLLQNVIFQQARCLESEEIILKSQVVVRPSITGLAPCYEHQVQSAGWLVGLPHGESYRSMRVTLVAMSEKVKYVSSTSYICPSGDCEGAREEMLFVKVFSPMGGKQISQECFNCGGLLQEQYNKRDVSEVVTGLVVGLGSTQLVEAVFREEEASVLVLGGQFNIVFSLVHMRTKKSQTTKLLEVVSVQPLLSGPGRLLKLTGDVHLPPVIHQLFKDRMESPWSFVLSLAYLLGGNVTPRGTFFKLKLGLLLSLVGSQDDGQPGGPGLHVLAAGEDDIFTPRLMRECLRLSVRPVVFTSASSLVGSITKGQVDYLEAGQLHLAREGVLYLGDFSSHKQAVRDQLARVVETGQVTSPPLRTSPSVTQPVTSSLWSYVSLSSIKHKPGSGKAALLNTIQDVVDMFGLVFFTDTEDKEVDSHLCRHSMEAEPLLPPGALQPDQLAAFLEQVRHRSVSIRKEALLLIKRYFLSSRRVRQVSATGPEFPQSALTTLIKLATSHAKLSLRLEVTVDDAVFACHLYEETVSSRSGYSYLGVAPSASIVEGTLNMVLGRENDRNMREFHIKLEGFIREYSMEEVGSSGGGAQVGRRGEVNNNEAEGQYCNKGEDDGWGGQPGYRHAVGGDGGGHCEE